jgi:hypothetical protein
MTIINTIHPKHGYVSGFAGGCFGTVRKFDGKYANLHVGDKVIMHHTHDPSVPGPAVVTEYLEVASIALGPLDLMLAHTHTLLDWEDVDKFKERIVSFYEWPGADDMYIVIYFR